MKMLPIAEVMVSAALVAGCGLLAARAEDPEQAEPKTRAAIDAAYDRELLQVERRRLDRLARLATGQPKDEANQTYEDYFKIAITRNLFSEAEPVAERVLKSADASTRVQFLAHLVNIIAEADRGAYQESLDSLLAAIRSGPKGAAAEADAVLPVETRLSIIDAYFQKLVRADQFAIARKALHAIGDRAENPAVKSLVARRLQQLDLVGKPAPPITGKDVDGQPVRLTDYKGDVVLVVFWASWCIPCAQQVAWLDQVYAQYRDRGFHILGVNLDALQEGGQNLEMVMPNIRRFLLDYNIPWPNLIDTPGDRSIARAYNVAEIPANFLIGRDGKVIHLALNGSNAEQVVAKAVGR
ncbi:MAG: redoxin domain-containing protein [Isosphaeraceae bacterium]|nr:redoxin domain-containing protein [Isosphaeraceae bacterium]